MRWRELRQGKVGGRGGRKGKGKGTQVTEEGGESEINENVER